jgi:hypothetical protein
MQSTARLESQLAELEQLRERYLPPQQRFESAPPNRELTASLTAELGNHFPSLASAQVQAECRGRLCRLVVPPALRNGVALAHFRESQFAGENLRELDSDGRGDGLLFEQLQHPDTIRGSDLLQGALQDFEASGAIEGCTGKFAGEGTLDAQVSIVSEEDSAANGQPTGISVRAGGPLAGTPLGNCIDAEFRRSLMAIALPPHYESATVMAQYPRR